MVIRVPDQRKTPGGYAGLDDRLLVLDFQAGNPQAFVEIHRRYGALARHVCQRFLPNQPDAEEAFQETMIRVFQGLYRFNGRYALQPWIARIAKNVSLDILRGHARRPKTDDSAPLSDELPVHGDEADEIVERLVQRDTVLAVLSDLPERHRRALILRELEGRSHREVAQEMEISTSQAKALIHRAKGSFRRRWLEKVADRGGMMGIALLPLLWPARFGDVLRRVADRVGFAAQSAQATVPEAVTSTITATAAPATSGATERLVAVGVTLLLAGGVTVGAAKVVRSGHEAEPKDVAAAVAVVPAQKSVAERLNEVPPRKDRQTDARHAGTTPVEEEPAVEPSPVEPSPEPEPSPSPEAETPPEETPPPPPPAPAWAMAFQSDVSTDETCECSDSRLIQAKVQRTPGGNVSFFQVAWGTMTDAEGDPAWALASAARATVINGTGSMDLNFSLQTAEGVFHYTGSAVLVETQLSADGATSYRFSGSFRIDEPVAEEVTIPRQGEVSAEFGLWSDGSLYVSAFHLFEF